MNPSSRVDRKRQYCYEEGCARGVERQKKQSIRSKSSYVRSKPVEQLIVERHVSQLTDDSCRILISNNVITGLVILLRVRAFGESSASRQSSLFGTGSFRKTLAAVLGMGRLKCCDSRWANSRRQPWENVSQRSDSGVGIQASANPETRTYFRPKDSVTELSDYDFDRKQMLTNVR